MHKPEATHEEMEKALLRLMPVALSEGAQTRMEVMIDGLAGEAKVAGFGFSKSLKWLGGVAAAICFGIYFSVPGGVRSSVGGGLVAVSNREEVPPELVFLTESDRVEGVSDEGMFVDSGGSAMRKVRVRVVEESEVRDEESGIVVMLSTPREEMYMVPVSTF